MQQEYKIELKLRWRDCFKFWIAAVITFIAVQMLLMLWLLSLFIKQ